MKFLNFLAICLFASLTGLYVLSCRSDDDSVESNLLIGTWMDCTDSTTDAEYVMFCKNNIAYDIMENSYHDGYTVEKLEYTYNESSAKLTLISRDYNYSKTFEVLSLSDTKLIMQDNSSYTITFTFEKTNSPWSESQLDKLYKEQNASSGSNY